MICQTLTIDLGVVRYRGNGTDAHATESCDAIADPTLPRDGTDLMPLRIVMRSDHPTLPRDGTDVMKEAPPPRVVNLRQLSVS